MAESGKFVLDTSAVLAFRSNETGAARVEEILRAAESRKAHVFLSFITRMEMLYRISSEEGDEEAASAVRLLDSTKAEWVSCEPEILVEAARIKARGGLSVADAWIAATASIRDAVLVHADPEFASVREIRQERLRR